MTQRQHQNLSVIPVTSPANERGEHVAGKQRTPEAEAVQRLYGKLGSWRAVAAVLGKTGAFWNRVARGKARGQTFALHIKRRLHSIDPGFLKSIQELAVPWMREHERTSYGRTTTNPGVDIVAP